MSKNGAIATSIMSGTIEALSSSRVLVTGSAGFIGSHLVEYLVPRAAFVRGFMRYNSRSEIGWLSELSPEIRNQVEIMRGDLKDPGSVRRAVAGIDVVLHLGALIAIPYSYQNPLDFVQTNVLGTSYLLMAAMDAGVRRVVQTSTSEVYGTAQTVPIDETHPLNAQSPYAASKIGADQLALSFSRCFSLPVVLLRPFNTYGPRQSLRSVIPTIIAQVLWRDRLTLGSLFPTRDFTYVEDTARAFALASTAALTGGEVVQIGSGQEISIGDLARKIMKLAGREVPIESEQQRVRPKASEVSRLLADNARAHEKLKWTPAIDLDEGLQRTIDWFKDRKDQFCPETYHV